MAGSDHIGIGMIGYAFMGKSHTLGYRDVPLIAPEGVPRPRLVSIYGRDAQKLETARGQLGWEQGVTDWREIVSDDRIQLLDNSGPNALHVEPTIAAARAGKHVFCEKPLGPTANDAFAMWDAAHRAGVKHMCAYNYRFFPALQLARQIIQSGEIGEIQHYRSQFLVSSSLGEKRQKSWRDDIQAAGAGALGDLGAHHIDVSRFLMGADPVSVQAVTRIKVGSADDGTRIETDDQFAALFDYDNGALGVVEASRVAGGHLVTSRIEVDGSKGSIAFSMQRLNELRVAGADKAFRTIPVIRNSDPYQSSWFPPGHPLGWVDTFSHEAVHILGAIAGLHDVEPIGATFRDGYYCSEIIDAAIRAASLGQRVGISYRRLND
ncbi:Gfo/Idh/MocA family protein [Mesorhizobium sp.]|nr:Gfo/Idh/MocA family oxidoreductase [Mesorhizobium sp.]RUW32856.1 Gfo/Idh/MocA family oxidoreductase [Mesorhizobium sp. M1E.F.Ca.ET.041.01.1.1]RWD84916.1 MAG: Gfo/Idh/MocA family oxidoreductase [Mesorhizobium sp.]RWD90041.1 MAG: Gfo/Idh/MocA family oxidoreductase [Mesorhizobium sp.]TIV54164.1 MAG: Gfo/Idh/MocA family oxidoreductase [Mesorhizobium sp.]